MASSKSSGMLSASKMKLASGFIIGCIIGYFAMNIYFGASDGDQAPEISAELIDGSPYSLSDSRGHYILLDFWGSWCGPCLRESPELVALSKKYAGASFDNGSKLHIVTVALEKNGDQWKRAAERIGFDWKRQIVHHHRIVMASPIANDYGVTDLPAKFLIDPDGNIVTAKASFEEIDDYLSARRQ